MQGSRAPSFIAGNELIGCMCPRRCLGAGYGPNRSMIFGSLRSMALQKSRKVRSMALQKSEESLNRETYQHTQTAELCGSNFESKVLEPPSQKPCGLNEMLEPNFLISEATKKRRITSTSSGSTEREEACAWSARNRARRPATLVTGARVGEGPRTRCRPGEPPVSRPGIARRIGCPARSAR